MSFTNLSKKRSPKKIATRFKATQTHFETSITKRAYVLLKATARSKKGLLGYLVQIIGIFADLLALKLCKPYLMISCGFTPDL